MSHTFKDMPKAKLSHAESDLSASSAALHQIATRQRVKNELLSLLNKEERRTNNSYITYDRIKLLISEM